MNIRCALLIFLFPFLASAAPRPSEASADPAAAPTPSALARGERGGTLSNGDTVSLQIVEDKEAEVEKRVSDTGDLDVPYIGRVHVAGKTCSDAAAHIKKLLEKDFDFYHHATVRLAINQFSKSSGSSPSVVAVAKINVSGENQSLRTPGMQEFPKTEKLTVSAAVLRAGPTMFANQTAVKLTRKKGDTTETIIVNVKKILKEGRLQDDIEVRDGDYIFVPRLSIVTGF